MADTKLIDLPALTSASSDDLLYIVDDPAGTPISKKITVGNLTSGLGGGGGSLVQSVNTTSSAVATGTTTIPADDTIPQSTEGTEFLTRSITPTSATNRLRIDVSVQLASSAASRTIVMGLFQDSTANALAATAAWQTTNDAASQLTLTHWMTAGTISATTFKVRAGLNAAGTITLNGTAAARTLGGVSASSLTVTEFGP